jgi:hypothetical protein
MLPAAKNGNFSRAKFGGGKGIVTKGNWKSSQLR